MKLLFLNIVIAIGFVATSKADSSKPTPVPNFDIARYQGQWHQLAAIPANFQDKCHSQTTAEYTLLDEDTLKVVNSCLLKDGQINSAEARGRVNSKYGLPATLEVTFVKFWKWWVWLFSGDYWVIDINDDYSVAIVGHPKREYGWILSRTPSLSDEDYSHLQVKLQKQGYDTCQFIMSDTLEQSFAENTRLCDLDDSSL